MSTRHVSWIMYISEFIFHVNLTFQVEGGRVDPHHLVRSKFFSPPTLGGRSHPKIWGVKRLQKIFKKNRLWRKPKRENHTTWNVLQSKRMLPKAGLCGWLPRVCQQRKNNRMRVISLELTHVSSEATSFVLVCSVCRSSGLFSSLVVQGWTKVTEASVCIYANAYIYIYMNLYEMPDVVM